MRIYLDNNATTPIHPEVLRVTTEALRDVFGNASSVHKEGQKARQTIEEARESVSALIGSEARDVIFTSGGTESNNASIFGAVPLESRHHIVTTSIEHPSVAAAVSELQRRGNRVTVVSPAPTGQVPAEAILSAITDDTRLVTLMLANNETGVIQPVPEVGAVCRERGIHLHCDAVQAIAKIDVNVEELKCDTLSIAGHKLHAPKGIGALYVRRGLTMSPYLMGGSQERRRRAGTENVPLAAALGAAARVAQDTSWRARIQELRDHFESSLVASDFEVTVNGDSVPRLPNTSNVSFHGVDGEALVIALDLNGIAVSSGSACSSGRVEPSEILIAMGISPENAKSTVRFSMSRFTTEREVEQTLSILREVVPRCMKAVSR